MSTSNPSVEGFATELHQKWLKALDATAKKCPAHLPVIALSMEPGSGGYLIAEKVAQQLGFHLYHRQLLDSVAHYAGVNPDALDLLEKTRRKGIEDLVSSILDDKYVSSGEYFDHLRTILRAMAEIGHAVIIGRGANFILAPHERFAVRVIAPLEVRVKNVSFAFGVTLKEAEKRIKNRSNKRRAFVKQWLHQDINDPRHYDLVLNTARLDVASAAQAVIGTIVGAQVNQAFDRDVAYILRRKA